MRVTVPRLAQRAPSSWGAVPVSLQLADDPSTEFDESDGADEHRRGRRWSTAARVSGLVRTYAAQRPAMLRDWAAGVDSDGAGGDVGSVGAISEVHRSLA